MKRILLLCFMGVFALFSVANAQERTVSGKVTSGEDGSGLPGVNVIIKGTATGATTDLDGNFKLSVPDGAVLQISAIGFKMMEVAVGARSIIDVTLETDVQQLSEVVVVGAGGIEARRKEMGYSTTSIQTSQLVQAKPTNVASGLTGKVAGLQINTTTSGVNPNVRVVLRGNRSITGNNEALVVVDNVIVPKNVLSSLNPEDIDNITILNGSNAAALYGSDGSNGALIITTKRGDVGKVTVRVGNTTNFERVSFYPEIQKEFGSGYAGGYPTQYVPYENQQYGPRFDGSTVQIGRPLFDGSIQSVPYTANNSKSEFWETGITNQTDLSISGGDDNSTAYFSTQYVKAKGTTPKDEYSRVTMRLNGSQELDEKLNLNYSLSYAKNVYDVTTQTANMYDQILQTPSHIQLTSYKDWRNDPFANPNGYYNEYYDNPYFTLETQRRDRKDNYLTGNIELKYKPVQWLDFTYRVGVSERTQTIKDKSAQFIFTEYTKGISPSKQDQFGGVMDGAFTSSQVTSDFFAQVKKEINSDLFVNLLVGNSLRANESKALVSVGNGIVIPDLYNIGNRIGAANAFEGNFRAAQVGVFGKLNMGFRDYLFLELTGRNDWNSILAKENRSFFYPSASVSFIATDAFEFLKFNGAVENLKIRGGVSQVGQVNLANRANFGGVLFDTYGAYQLNSTFSPSVGFPFGSLVGYSPDNRLVSPSLKPEITNSAEIGIDFTMLQNRVSGSFTTYKTITQDQTIATGISNTTGYSSYLQNTGETSNLGYETMLNLSVYRNESLGLEAIVGGNYTYNENMVESISGDLPRLQLSTGAQAQVYAIEGRPFPMLLGTSYNRDPQGRIIVDRETGYPSAATELVELGNTVPKHRLSFNGEVRFKGLRLYALFEYRGGYNILFSGGSSYDFSGSSITSTYFNRDRFVIPNSSYEDPENPGTYIPNNNITVTDGGANYWTDGSFRTNIADNYVISGDYWKLRELVISYDVPRTVLEKTGLFSAASVSLQGRNLFMWTPKSNVYTDPDLNFDDQNAIGIVSLSATPPTRFYGATVSLTF